MVDLRVVNFDELLDQPRKVFTHLKYIVINS